jgi:hypothetical protein
MTNKQPELHYEIGMVGLGAIGDSKHSSHGLQLHVLETGFVATAE